MTLVAPSAHRQGGCRSDRPKSSKYSRTGTAVDVFTPADGVTETTGGTDMTDQADRIGAPSPQAGADAPPQPGWWQASDGRWYPPQAQPGVAPPPPSHAMAPPSNGMATAALVLGIISICLFWAFGVGVVLGVLAIIFGVVGKKKASSLPGQFASGRAVAGLVTGIIGVVAGGIFFMAVVAATDDAVEEFERIGSDINSDPSDGWCDSDRYWQDPDC